jgi:CTP synthase
VASQYHPEFKSRPDRPAPLFREFVRAALARADERRPQDALAAAESAGVPSGSAEEAGEPAARFQRQS